MVDALASDRSDQSFGKAVLPRRAWSDSFVADAHGSQSMPDGNAIDLIPIADQVARGLIPRECLCDLTDQRHTSSNRRLDRATEQFEEEAKVLWVALVRCRGHQKIVVRHRRQRLTELVGERFLSALYAAILCASSTITRSQRLRSKLSLASSMRETQEIDVMTKRALSSGRDPTAWLAM